MATIGEAYLQIKPSMEGVKGELEQAMGDAGASSSSSFGSAFASGIGVVTKAVTSAVGVAATGVSAITKQSVDAYADYEQLVGGVETLFGAGGKTLEEFAETASVTTRDIENSGIDWDKYADTAWFENGGISGLLGEMKYNFDELGTSAENLEEYLHFEYDLSLDDAKAAVEAYQNALTDDSINAKYESMMTAQQTLLDNAARAYETAGMSANDYMETAIQSAAAMVNSLGGDQEEAARLVDMSITDMADNVNKMGTSMEAVQNAYRGFSRGNFTMLDNLALGFAGTKEGMEELLAKAQELSGVEYDIDSYADIVQAIHVVQDEMGITGTTSEEAAGTISGSLATFKAAWDNLIAGFANPDADLGTLIGNFVKSARTYLDNLMPTIQQALTGIGQVITQITPIIIQLLPGLINTLVPPLIEAAVQLVNALVQALPDIISILLDQLPILIDLIVNTILTMLPLIVELGLQFIMALADGLIQNLPTLIPTIVDIVLTMADKLTDPDTLVMLIDAAIQLILALAEGVVRAIPKLIQKAPEIVMNLVEAVIKAAPLILDAGSELIFKLIEGVMTFIFKLVEVGVELVESVKEGFWEKVEAAKNWGKDLIQNFIDGIKAKWENLKSTVTDLASTIKSLLGFSEPEVGPLSNFHTFAPDMMMLFAKGIRDNLGLIQNAMGDVTGAIATDFSTAQIATNNYSPIADPNERLYGLVRQNMAVDGGDITIPIYIGQEKLDTIILNAQQRHALVSGGR